jgi:hypothetical protein
MSPSLHCGHCTLRINEKGGPRERGWRVQVTCAEQGAYCADTRTKCVPSSRGLWFPRLPACRLALWGVTVPKPHTPATDNADTLPVANRLDSRGATSVWEMPGSEHRMSSQKTQLVCLDRCLLRQPAPLWSSGQRSWLHNGDVLCFL